MSDRRETIFEAGEIRVEGGIEGPVRNHSTLEAQKRGISTVYQEVNLCPNLSVAENLFIGREPMTKMHTINRKAMISRARQLMEQLNLPVDVTRDLEEYSPGHAADDRHRPRGGYGLQRCSSSTSRPPPWTMWRWKLFTLMRSLRDKGVGIVFVTHFLEQVYAVCGRITVLRNAARWWANIPSQISPASSSSPP